MTRSTLLIAPALTALAALGAANAASGDESARAARTVGVTIADDVFKPGRVSIDRGDTVRWTWRGRNEHNVTVTSGPRRFESRSQSRGTFSRTLRRAGTYRIICTLHSGMRMRVNVD